MKNPYRAEIYMLLVVLAISQCSTAIPCRQKREIEECTKAELKPGKIINPPEKQPTETIEDEAKKQGNEKLFDVWSTFKNGTTYNATIQKGADMGLNSEQTTAVHLYTCPTPFQEEFNKGLREGTNSYPVYFYWLDKALSDLNNRNGPVKRTLYRGATLNFTVPNTTLTLPAFTSTSKDEEVARIFWKKGCSFMIFQSSNKGADVKNLSAVCGEEEVLIPPSETFEITKIVNQQNETRIYLKPVTLGTVNVSADLGSSVIMTIMLGTLSSFYK